MPSLVTGFEYDIFISYRQKDNKYDGWVTEFVTNLKKELEATFKEDISLYFDINPHDGLLETHDVDASLKEKLKCLIFIPVISRTYPDPKSFAWEHEFKAFIEQATKDRFGIKIRLPNGNIANRILPIQINDLHHEDKLLLEKELGGVLRAIEFIYREPGVNRPLRVNDNEEKNSNKTNYRNQINKIANAIDEVINTLIKEQANPEWRNSPYVGDSSDMKNERKDKNLPRAPEINKRTKRLLIGMLTFFLSIASVYFLFKVISINKIARNRKNFENTIAVLPFRNLSNDTLQLPFCDGFMEDILNNLQKVKSFTVRPKTSSYQYKDSQKSTAIIRKELNVNYLVGGSIGREGNNLKIRVYLVDSNADKQVWSNDYTRGMNQLFSLQSEIAKEIASELKAALSADEIKMIERRPTENQDAYKYYLQGEYYYWKNDNSGNTEGAIELYQKAIDLDPRFALAYTGMAKCLLDQYWYFKDRREEVLQKCKFSIDKAFEIDPDLPEAHLALGIYYYHGYLKYQEAMKQFELILKDQPKNANVLEWLGAVYRRAGNWDKAKSYFEKASEYNPGSSSLAQELGLTYDFNRDYSKAEEYYNKAILLQPDWVYNYYALSNLILRWKGDTKKAREVLTDAGLNNKSSPADSMIIEASLMIDIYEGNYQEALKEVSLFKNEVIQTHWDYRPKYLYYANIYSYMNRPDLEHAYYDSARFYLEQRIGKMHDDPAFNSTLGIVYAGLGLKEKAIEAGKRGAELMSVDQDALRGITRTEDLAIIYVMFGKYDEAIKQIRYLLSIPGFLTTKILELDPRWSPLRIQPEFRKMMSDYSIK